MTLRGVVVNGETVDQVALQLALEHSTFTLIKINNHGLMSCSSASCHRAHSPPSILWWLWRTVQHEWKLVSLITSKWRSIIGPERYDNLFVLCSLNIQTLIFVQWWNLHNYLSSFFSSLFSLSSSRTDIQRFNWLQFMQQKKIIGSSRRQSCA